MEIPNKEENRNEGRTSPAEVEENEGLDIKVIQLLDATDEYLKLYHSLSDAMRQGWLQIASARYSMGSSRISGTLFSLKPQSAHTSMSLEYKSGVSVKDENTVVEEAEGKMSALREKYPTCFTLHKWENNKEVEGEVDVGLDEKRSGSQLRQRLLSHSSDKSNREALRKKEDSQSNSGSRISQVQKRKYDALSLFGTLVSPQLRFAQVSFETALEILVQLANARNTILSVLDEISREKENGLCATDREFETKSL